LICQSTATPAHCVTPDPREKARGWLQAIVSGYFGGSGTSAVIVFALP